MLFKNAFVFTGNAFETLDVRVENGVIAALGALEGEGLDCTGKYLLPGLVDVHTHGCGGYDFDHADREQLRHMERVYAAHGTTTVLATLMTNPLQLMLEAARRCGEMCGGVIRGIHLEGPFLSPAKKGAHREEYLMPPSVEVFDRLLEASGGRVRLVVVDPCAAGAMDFIRAVAPRTRIAIGHTPADYETAKEAFAHGATQVTHLFNAMDGLHHRKPGLVGAALTEQCFAEVICDGIHVHPAVLRLSFAALGERGLVISDSMAACGLEDGEYSLGGQAVSVRGRRATLADGTLAGSVTFAWDGMRQLIQAGVPREQAAAAATRIPAASVGLSDVCGAIAPGRRANLVLADGDFRREAVWLEGERV